MKAVYFSGFTLVHCAGACVIMVRTDFVNGLCMTAKDWRPTAAYLYVLHLDSIALAWEYLRRNSNYRRDWEQFGQWHPAWGARNWGLNCCREPLTRRT